MLNATWITDKIIDFEYKKYLLLAYFQSVEIEFKNKRLYPYYADLLLHYTNLKDLVARQHEISNFFSKDVIGIDLKQEKIIYKKTFLESSVIKEIETIVNYSLPKFQYYLNEGEQLNQFVNNNISIHPIGLEPIYKMEGYFLIQNKADAETQIFHYSSSVCKGNESRYINYSYVKSEKNSIINTPEKIKCNLVLKNRNLPNPAAYWVESKCDFPFQETLLPVVINMIAKII